MVDLQAVVAIAIAVLVALFVPGLVWATVIAGLYQLIRQRIRERQAATREQAEDMRGAWSAKSSGPR